jgi:hypothetical protein
VDKLLEMVAIDYKGPINISSNQQYKGYIVIVDLYSSYSVVFGVREKDEIIENFIEF